MLLKETPALKNETGKERNSAKDLLVGEIDPEENPASMTVTD